MWRLWIKKVRLCAYSRHSVSCWAEFVWVVQKQHAPIAFNVPNCWWNVFVFMRYDRVYLHLLLFLCCCDGLLSVVLNSFLQILSLHCIKTVDIFFLFCNWKQTLLISHCHWASTVKECYMNMPALFHLWLVNLLVNSVKMLNLLRWEKMFLLYNCYYIKSTRSWFWIRWLAVAFLSHAG